jgi:hypothetical protein
MVGEYCVLVLACGSKEGGILIGYLCGLRSSENAVCILLGGCGVQYKNDPGLAVRLNRDRYYREVF